MLIKLHALKLHETSGSKQSANALRIRVAVLPNVALEFNCSATTNFLLQNFQGWLCAKTRDTLHTEMQQSDENIS